MAEDNKDASKQVTVMPFEPGSVTTLNGTTITAIGQPGSAPSPHMMTSGWPPANWSANPPVVMIPPQQPMILIISDNKKEAASDKQHSRVFTRL
jgi:hypothetical protein